MSLPEPFTPKDADWPARIARGDERAFRQLFDTYYEPLCRYATTLVGNPDTSEDLVQALFVWIWEHRAEWDIRGSLRGYLYRAVHSRVINQWRATRVREVHAEAERRETGEISPVARENWPDRVAQYSEVQAAYDRAVAALPPRARQAFELNRQHGLSSREVAEVMGISPRTVEAHVGRALLVLRKALVMYLAVALMVTGR